MTKISDIFEDFQARPKTQDGVFSEDEVRLANRNSGILLETLRHDVTPIGLHYLLIHFDVPYIDTETHRLEFADGFETPFSLSLDDIRALPQITLPVTLECAGNGRTGLSPRTHSMPWSYEAVGTSEWTGTTLAPLIKRARPSAGTVEISFTGEDKGFDKGVEHAFGRSLTLDQIESLDVMLVHSMNGQPLLPQHGAPLRIIVPGWYGMASVKWLSKIEALDAPYQGYQQVNTYRYREHKNDLGQPVTSIRIKSLMTPPGIPDWITRLRHLRPGPMEITGRAWSGNGAAVVKVEFNDGVDWQEATVSPPTSRYAWAKWSIKWDAKPGSHTLCCRATDSNGDTQPLEPVWDASGFGNNAVQSVSVYVGDANT
ncbi:MAG: DMSO/TMAO reductase YedYZ molybdopterin-dependent catalytic subunit [Granulosicoccus sp.]|jgi:DMSO/TMAO reductase YedYZ molybdopterin-dependent catalytic subunit